MLNRKFFFSTLCIVLPLLLFCISLNGQVDPRDIIWAHGTSQTSKGWYDFRNEMVWEGFFFNDIITGTLYDDAVVNGVLATAQYLDQRVDLQEGNNVLGIGHGFGGIALRYAQLENEEISAMVLSGVPNQGSHAILKSTRSTSGITEIQLIIEKVNAIKLGDNCADCNITGLFESWVNDIESASNFLGDLRPVDDVIVNINKTQNLPTIPYIVLYGTVQDFSLTRLLDTRGSVSDDDALVRCQEERIREESKNIQNLEIQGTIQRTNGFFANVLAFAGSFISGQSSSSPTGAALSAISNYINQETNRIIQDIQAQQEIENELARMLRCQLANQLQEAEWMLMMLDGSFQEQEILVFDVDLFSQCMAYCGMNNNYPGGGSPILECFNHCEGLSLQPQAVQVFVAEPTNGLLAESEQKLAGPNLVSEIHLPNTNHFQMTMRTHEVLVEEFKDNIFSGSLGAAFLVPKN